MEKLSSPFATHLPSSTESHDSIDASAGDATVTAARLFSIPEELGPLPLRYTISICISHCLSILFKK